MRNACVWLIRSGGRKRTVRKQGNGMQTVEIQCSLSTNQKPDSTDRQRLILHCHNELSVKEGFDKVLADNGVPLDSQHVPGNRLGLAVSASVFIRRKGH